MALYLKKIDSISLYDNFSNYVFHYKNIFPLLSTYCTNEIHNKRKETINNYIRKPKLIKYMYHFLQSILDKPAKSLLIVEPSIEKVPSSSSGVGLDFSDTSSTFTKLSIPLSSIAKCALIPLLSAPSLVCLSRASATPVKVIVDRLKLPITLKQKKYNIIKYKYNAVSNKCF